jgi:hypothetical protein
MQRKTLSVLTALVLLYAIASIVHFIHNAEFLSAYPGLPRNWTRSGVYLAWAAMTVLGFTALLLVVRGVLVLGLVLVLVYAALGFDSLGHYVVAPFSAHTAMMNFTILLEVGCASLLFVAGATLLTNRLLFLRRSE